MPGGIKRGQVLTKENLNVFFYVGGNLTDPFSVTYTLYDSTTGTDQIIGLPDRTPIKFAVGSYYAPWEVPDDEPTGLHKIEWKYKDTATAQQKIEIEEIEILGECAATGYQYSDFVMWLIRQLRIKLRDVNPDRDYHFAPPSSEATIAGFTETRGFRWPDEQLFSHLLQARNYINLIPPDTDFDLDGYPAPWQSLLLLQAMSYALWDLSILWINEEFNYDVNGISLDLNKSDKYQGAASAMQDMVNSQAELAKSRIHIIKGLAQSRYTFGRGAALGPWCLFKDSKVIDINNNETITIEEAFNRQIKLSYSMNLETNELIENEVVKIWSNGIQELYKMNLENGSEIECTKTHVFFTENNEEKELQELEIGQKIWVKDSNILKLSQIKNVEKTREGETYDMEMKEPFRNYVAEGIVVHNTGGQNIKRWVSGGVGMGGVRIGF